MDESKVLCGPSLEPVVALFCTCIVKYSEGECSKRPLSKKVCMNESDFFFKYKQVQCVPTVSVGFQLGRRVLSGETWEEESVVLGGAQAEKVVR